MCQSGRAGDEAKKRESWHHCNVSVYFKASRSDFKAGSFASSSCSSPELLNVLSTCTCFAGVNSTKMRQLFCWQS